MKRVIAIIICAALLLLCGCEAEKAAYVPTGDALTDETSSTVPEVSSGDHEISLAYYSDRSLNPYECTDYTNRVLFSLIYQGLFVVDRNYEISPILCKSYNVSKDLRSWTFYLAEAYFSDGAKVTAADVVASLQAAKGSTYYGGRLQHVSSITGYGDAVIVDLDTPMENLPILLDIPVVKAAEVTGEKPLGSGPYLLGDGVLRRQAGWWCSSADLSVNCDTIPLVEVESTTQIRDAFEFYDVSLVCSDPGAADYVDFHSDHELWDCENGQFLYMVCNNKSKIFSDTAFRSALTHAIDRELLVQTYYRGLARAATLPASPQSPYYSASLAEHYAYNPEKFQEAVTAADLEGTQITLLFNADDVMRQRVGRAIADMLETGGLKVTIVEATSSNFASLLKKGNYDLYLGQTKLSANMDLSAFFGTKTSLNYGGLSDPANYALSLESLANSGNYYNLHKTVMDEAWLCPILFQNYALYVKRGDLPNLSPARDNVFCYTVGRTMTDALITG